MPHITTPGGLKLYYHGYGNPDGEPILCIAGLASTSRIWEPQAAALGERYRFWCMDFPGHGDSGRLPRYSLEGLAIALRECHDALRAKYGGLERVHLMGLSMGCPVLLSYAAQHPERVASLILHGPFAGNLPAYHPVGFLLWLAMGAYVGGFHLGWRLLGMRGLMRLVSRYGVQLYRYSPLLFSIQQQLDPQAYQDLAYGLLDVPILSRLGDVTCPVLVLRGTGDVTPMSHAQRIIDGLGGPTVFQPIPEARHIVGLDRPEQVNDAIGAFLRRYAMDAFGNRSLSMSSAR